ncbi:MAG: ssDNA-binding replication factor A large subunit [Glaciecola sp.]|jgi:ssDNA-binding replication factor A large subunit
MAKATSKGIMGGPKGLVAVLLVVSALLVQKFTGIDLIGTPSGDGDDKRGVSTEASEGNPSKPDTSVASSQAIRDLPAKTANAPQSADNGVDFVHQQFKAQRSSVWVTTEGEVVHLLADDNSGSRHQQFLLELDKARDFTVKVAHNIDDAPYIPLERGDTIKIQGRYEFNDKGGVIHFTHRADRPTKRKPGGWIDHKGKRYQ